VGCWLGRLDDRGVQAGCGVTGERDGDRGEPGGLQQVAVLGLGEGAVEAADLLFGAGALGGVGAFAGDDVADAQPAAGPQHPERLGQDAGRVGGQVDDTVGDDHVHVPGGQRDVLDVAVQEPGVGDAGGDGVGPGEGEHVGAGVQAVGGAAGGNPAGGQQHVQAAAGAEGQDGLPGMEGGGRDRVAAAQAGPQGTFGDIAGSGVGGGAEVPAGERVRVAVGDGAAGQGGSGQAGITPDDDVPVTRCRVVGHGVLLSDQVAGMGAGRPITTSAAVGKHSTHASLIR